METKQLDSATAELVRWITEQAQNAATFTKAEIPDLVQQLLTYKFYESIMTCVSVSVAIMVLVGMVISTYKCASFYEDSDGTVVGVIRWVCSFFAIIFFAIGMAELPSADFIMIKMAPKLYLLEYAKDLL